MSRRCTVCDLPEAQRRLVDRELAGASATIRDVARRAGVSRSSVFRHGQSHLPGHLVAAAADQRFEAAADVLAALRRGVSRLDALSDQLHAAIAGGNTDQAGLWLAVLAKLDRLATTLLRAEGELRPDVVVAVAVDPELVQRLLERLGPWPEARRAVGSLLAAAS